MRKGINNKGKYPSPLRINVKGDGWVLNCRLSTPLIPQHYYKIFFLST